MLDLAARTGRHTRLLLETGFAVCVVDRDISALLPLAGAGREVRQVDLETGAPWVLGTGYDGIVIICTVRCCRRSPKPSPPVVY